MRKYATILAIATALYSGSAVAEGLDSQQSPEGMLKEASQGVERLESIIQDGQEKLAQAKEESDVSRIDCINSLLVNARGFLSVVQNGESNLKDAVSRNDQEAQNHHYKLVQLGVSKGNDIAAKMTECATGVVGVTGTTISETVRTCTVEPCLGGEEYYDSDKSQPIEDTGSVLDVDASAYL